MLVDKYLFRCLSQNKNDARILNKSLINYVAVKEIHKLYRHFKNCAFSNNALQGILLKVNLFNLLVNNFNQITVIAHVEDHEIKEMKYNSFRLYYFLNL